MGLVLDIIFGFIGLVLDIMWCVLISVAKVPYVLACDLLKSVQTFCSAVRAAGDYLNAVEHDGIYYICLQKVCAHDVLGPAGNPVRTLQIGEEVCTSHSTRCLAYGKPWWCAQSFPGARKPWRWGAQTFPGAVKLIDGGWIDLRMLPAGTAFPEHGGSCSPVAKLHRIEPDAGHFIVCKQQLDVQESCSLDSPVVRVLQRGEIIPAPRRSATLYLNGSDPKDYEAKPWHNKKWLLRFEMEDHTWTTCGTTDLSCALSDSHYLMPASNREISAGPRERRALAHIRYLKQEIKTYKDSHDVMVHMYGLSATAICSSAAIQAEISFKEKKLARAQHELARLESDLASGLIEDNADYPLPSEPEEVTSVFQEVDEFLKLCFKGFDELLRTLLSELLPPQGLVPSSRCFLPGTMLWTSESTAVKVESLKENDKVLNFKGTPITVASIKIHEDQNCDVVELRTREATLTVTATHRVLIPNEQGTIDAVKYACDLCRGDKVFCGVRPEPLVKVLKHKMRTRCVEIQFEPDDPVESFLAPKWSVLSKGQSPHYDTDDGFWGWD